MNSLQDLRDTLEAHAGDVHDDTARARVAAVEGRARAVRRRRAAGVVGAAVVAVAAVTAVTVVPGDRDPRPSDRELIGKEAPETIDSLGYTYHFVEGVESGDRRALVRLRSSDVPRLVTWAADADEVVVDSNIEGYRVRSAATDFDDFMVVPAVESGRWQVRAGGADAAIAVYELGEERPDGVTASGVTFRERVADEQLVGARIGEEGETDLTLRVTVPEGRFRVAELCTGVPDEYEVNVEVGERGVISSGGCDDDAFDPGSGSASFFDAGELGRPGQTVRARTWVSERFDGEPVQLDGVRLGLAGYAQPSPVATIAGWDVPYLLEHEGHLWRYADSVETSPGEDRLVVDRTWQRPTLVRSQVRGVGRLGRVMVGSGVDATLNAGGGAFAGLETVLGPGRDTFPMTVRSGLTGQTQLGVSLYERAD